MRRMAWGSIIGMSLTMAAILFSAVAGGPRKRRRSSRSKRHAPARPPHNAHATHPGHATA
jgi:hypothetical protein